MVKELTLFPLEPNMLVSIIEVKGKEKENYILMKDSSLMLASLKTGCLMELDSSETKKDKCKKGKSLQESTDSF